MKKEYFRGFTLSPLSLPRFPSFRFSLVFLNACGSEDISKNPSWFVLQSLSHSFFLIYCSSLPFSIYLSFLFVVSLSLSMRFLIWRLYLSLFLIYCFSPFFLFADFPSFLIVVSLSIFLICCFPLFSLTPLFIFVVSLSFLFNVSFSLPFLLNVSLSFCFQFFYSYFLSLSLFFLFNVYLFFSFLFIVFLSFSFQFVISLLFLTFFSFFPVLKCGKSSK